MASNNRNKLDEYHLKILRELLTHQANKYCFDCNQRGPTYVNVTIGSFVCTHCSGMLRGLTPPHRVKSITMATFTPEEIEIMKSRGNQDCKNIWLGLYDAEIPMSDEQKIKDFMIAKYERKRYYFDPTSSNTHGVTNFRNGSRVTSLLSTSSSSQNSPFSLQVTSDCASSSSSTSSTTQPNACPLRSPPPKIVSVTSNGNSQLFTSNFESAVSSTSLVDPFKSAAAESLSSSETSFANFDNNPVFDVIKPSVRTTYAGINNSNNISNTYAGFGLTWGYPGSSYHKPSLKTLSLSFSRWSIATENTTKFGNKSESSVPPEDKYAALKDLDFQMKNQFLEKQKEEMKQKLGPTSNGVNWSLLFSNSQCVSSEPVTPLNPFSGDVNAWNPTTNGTANPFNNTIKDTWNGNSIWQNNKNGFPSTTPVTQNGWKVEEVNPFKFQLGVWNQTNGQHHSSNPFL